jgi:hypothetical protein
MKRLIALSAGALIAAGVATASIAATGDLMSSVPRGSVTVTDWYKQSVYDASAKNKIGEIMDVLVSRDGKVNALIVGVGGFLGAGEKDVAVSFDAVKPIKKDNATYLTMNTTKKELKAAPGLRYDKQTTSWVPAKS